MNLFGKHFVAAIAAFSSGATLLTILFNVEWLQDKWYYGVLGMIFIILFSLCYAYWQTKSKVEIILELSSKLKLTISEGDIFNKKGVICIPFNEYFDTHVGDGVVGENTIHGLFINKYFRDRIPELEEKISKGLENIKCEQTVRRYKGCPTEKYPLGTTVDIRDGENLYVLFALTHFDENDKAYISRNEYVNVITKLMDHLSEVVEERSVYMPLIGAGLSRLQRTPQRILYQIISILDFDNSITVPGGVNVVIKSLKKENINLTLLEHIVKNGIIKES